MLRRTLLLSITVVVAACVAQSPRSSDPPVRLAVRGTHMAVAAGSEYATEAGMQISLQGGTAVDVGVGSMFAASVTELSHFGLGGEAPILIRTEDGKVYSISGVGPMPKLATAELFRNRPLQPGEITFRNDGSGLKGVMPNAGIMAAIVPGMVDAGLVALKQFGTMSFAQVIAPAIDYADGYVVDEVRANALASGVPFFKLWPTSEKHFMPNGHTPRVGEVYHQPDLAKTLRAMVGAEEKALADGKSREEAIDAVRDYFYRGPIAREIAAFSEANGGLLRYDDFAGFHAEVEQPVTTTYHGYHVYKPGFWTQGPDMIEALNILEGFEDRQPLNSAEYIHRQVEALKLAYADRDTYYGDPKFTDLELDQLLTKEYAAKRRALIGERASLTFQPGDINGVKLPHPTTAETVSYEIDDRLMSHDTTCVDAIDSNGIQFSATPSSGWVPAVIAGNTGIPLSQRAQSFVLVEGHPNIVEGGKRPRITLSPTIVTTPDGKPYASLSTPGADVQDQALLQVLLDTLNYGLDSQQSVEYPRYQTRHMVSSMDNHAWDIGLLKLDERIPRSVAQELAARGHQVQYMSKYANGSAPVMVKFLENGVIEAGADPFYNRSARAR